MNIFVIDSDPEVSAIHLCDKHIVKMPLESAQMLCTISWRFGLPAQYKPSFQNHPCTRWAGETWGNWHWLVKHAIALCVEYERRYRRQHASYIPIIHCAAHGGRPVLASPSLLTPFVQVMPEKYKQVDAVSAYRAYYIGEKARFARWSHAKPPVWWPAETYHDTVPMH